MAAMDLEKIEGKIDRVVAGAVGIDISLGGIQLTQMAEVFEVSKLMSVSRTAVPKHLRENPGACFAVCIQALELKMSPFAVANKSYEVNDRIAYEAQLIMAVINARAPLESRLRFSYSGEGVEKSCTVTGQFKGEATPQTYTSPKIRDIKVKNSPLWTSDPEQQLAYFAGRSWCRRYAPEVLLGIYAADELENTDPIGSSTTSTGPKVGDRLKGAKGRGFNEEGVTKALAHTPAATLPTAAAKSEPVTVPAGAATETVIEAQFELVTDPATEIGAKKLAIANCETVDDVTAMIASTTQYLKDEKRPDLLADFLSVADKRAKSIQKAAKADPVAA